MIDRARQLRRHQTGPETKLWHAIRNSQLAGLKFRRQRPIGRYVVDFYCASHKLVVELDGDSHNESNYQDDVKRQAWLEKSGYRVLRIENDDVLKDLDAVLEVILVSCGKDV